MFISSAVFEDSRLLLYDRSYRDLNVSKTVYSLLVMRISIVILYLISFHDYIVYKKRPPQSDTSVHVCIFVLYIAVMVSFRSSHCLTPSLTIFQDSSFCSFTLAVKSSGVDGGPTASLLNSLDSLRVRSSQDPHVCYALRRAILCGIVPRIVFDSLLLVLSQLTSVVLVCRAPPLCLAGL